MKAVFMSENGELLYSFYDSNRCGLDSITTDQVHEILERYNKIYTLFKIGGINSLEAVRILKKDILF